MGAGELEGSLLLLRLYTFLQGREGARVGDGDTEYSVQMMIYHDEPRIYTMDNSQGREDLYNTRR